MIQYILSLCPWTTWAVILIAAIFILWIFFGGGNYRLIGLSPFMNQDLKEVYGTEEYKNKVAELTPEDTQRKSGHDKKKRKKKRPEESSTGLIPSESGEAVEVGPIVNKLRAIPDDMDVSIDATPNIPDNVLLADKPRDILTRNLKPSGRKTSKKEERCRQILENIYGKPFPAIRPDWLRNPETNRNLELDGYNDELKIGFEYNGQQHYVYPNYTGQTLEQFKAQVRRDIFKINKCDEQGVYVITIPYSVPDHLLEDYIRYYLPENYSKRVSQV